MSTGHRRVPAAGTVVLLGPQRLRPTVARTLNALGVRGTVATVTAGWQEREADDAELKEHLGGRAVNLELYARYLDIRESDHEYAVADARRQEILLEMRELYEVRLDAALNAVYALQRRHGTAAVRDAEVEAAIASVRELDEHHFSRTREVYREFYASFPPHERLLIRRHRDEVARALEGAAALAVAGGHVGVLIDCLHLFNVGAALRGRPVLAWSAGAMAVCDRVVLFHDDAAQGMGHAEVFDAGIGLCEGVVPLPHARRRLHLDDRDRMSVMARRFAPALCIPLDGGDRIDCGAVGDKQRIIRPDGQVKAREAA